MKKHILLKRFDCIIPDTADKSASTAGHGRAFRRNTPQLTVAVDFEKGKFNLSGPWAQMTKLNSSNASYTSNEHAGHVVIDIDIYPSTRLDLGDHDNNGWVLVLEGMVSDMEKATPCSGLLVVDDLASDHAGGYEMWNMTVYLYESSDNTPEMKFCIPLFPEVFSVSDTYHLQ